MFKSRVFGYKVVSRPTDSIYNTEVGLKFGEPIINSNIFTLLPTVAILDF